MSLIPIYAKMSILDVMRNKSAFFFGILFPVILFLMFGQYDIKSQFDQIGSLVVFANYAVQTVFIQSLGMQISMRRSSEWTIYLRTLPVSSSVLMIALIIEKSISALLSLSLVILANIAIHGMLISWTMTLYLILGAMIGGIPMAFLGIAIGNKTSPDLARNACVFVNLALLFSAFALPSSGFWNYVKLVVPAHHWARIVMSHFEAGDPQILPWIWMLGYGILFYGLAIWSYKTRKNLRNA